MKRRPSFRRKAWEAVIRTVMPNDWPARIAVSCGAPTTVRVTRHEIEIQKRLGSARTLRIAFASDWHAGPTTAEETLDHAVATLVAEKPDVLLLGGDFVVSRVRDATRLAQKLDVSRFPLGVFAVLGNHDHYVGGAEVAREFEAVGVRMMTNASRAFPEPFEGITLCGIDDYLVGSPDASRAFAEAGDVRVLLMHQPSGLLDVHPHTFDLALCGHTHGGQIALPGPIPILAGHGPLSRRYVAGRYKIADAATLITSRGVGCSILPIRWNSPAEIVVCSLTGI
jgi:predicted MPP superfamily phosphohydrolase